MITPRTTRLWRVPDLRAFQRAIIGLVPRDAFHARGCAVIVPTRGAAEELRRTIEHLALDGPEPVAAMPDLVTRDDLYGRLREQVPGSPRVLSAFEREVLLRRSADAAAEAGCEPPFNIRAGLVAEILGLYDELRRRHKTVADFERLLVSTLEPGATYDRGAARLLQQTHFLVETFSRFEQAVDATGGFDEHRLREAALNGGAMGYRRVIVTVGDQAVDRRGLWTTDFDLLTRLPGLEFLDVVSTDGVLDAGFLERVHALLPGIEEHRHGPASPDPIFVVPEAVEANATTRAFVCRDREEELVAMARRVKATRDGATPLGRMAIVFQRPLPYLYLARQVFADARVAWQALDALPLAGEPFPATVDLIFSAISADFTRGALVDLLRCPHLQFAHEGQAITLREIAKMDALLVTKKYLGGVDRLIALSADASAALRAAAAAAQELDAAIRQPSASQQIDAALSFIARHERLPEPDRPWAPRHMRARAAVLSALKTLRDAHAAHDDRQLTIAELSGAVRRWIGGQTFSPRLGTSGLMLLDARAAAFADVDELRIVGLTEGDWPERSERNIFYPQSLLAQLGWPNEQDRVRAARVQFQELLRLPHRRVSLSTFSLEDDGLVSPSALLDEVDAVGLPIERDTAAAQRPVRVLTHDAISTEPVVAAAVDGEAAAWLRFRASRPAPDGRFRGSIGERAPGVYAISRVEKYLDCPFRYFAGYILRLPEERDEEGWMTPQERGVFVHEVFQQFFEEWQARGHGAVTTTNLSDAVTLFREIAEARLETLPEGDRALERTLLLGSAAAAGLGERAFAVEIEDAVEVVERLLEYELEGTFTFAARDAERAVSIRAKADRIDLLADGTLRVIDYKLGRAPQRKRALQLPIYGVSAQQALDGRHGRSWTVSRAGYVAFKEKGSFAEIGRSLPDALAEGQARLIAAVEGIERGAFPVDPDEPFLCNWCPYPSVCRKDYVGDE